MPDSVTTETEGLQREVQVSFDCADYLTGGIRLSYLDSRSRKPTVHFYHANGFPVSMYLPLLERLGRDFRVIGLSLRGQDGLSEGIRSWHVLASDLIGFLDHLRAGPVVGIGHSIGAVATLFAACQRPDLFSKIILLDPVLLPWRHILSIRVAGLLGKKSRFPLARRARARRRSWGSRQEALDYFRGKSLFEDWQEPFLRAYVTYGLKPAAGGGVELLCPPEAEAQAFENYPTDLWRWPRKLKRPALIVRGEHSDTLLPGCCQRFCRLSPAAQAEVVRGTGHLFPMQDPDRSIQIIKAFGQSPIPDILP